MAIGARKTVGYNLDGSRGSRPDGRICRKRFDSITVKAERRVVEELVEEAREVRGKAGILFRVAEAAIGRPEGVVREVIFPVVGEQTFEAPRGA